MQLKIGELSRRTGVTIRALRHYDEIGLLSPSARTEGGFRLYGDDDVARLYRIQALASLDLPLSEIQAILAAGGAALPAVVTRQIAFLDHQVKQASALRDHLAALQARAHAPSSMDDWLSALARMSALSRYFDDGERAALHGAAGKAALTAELQQLMAQGAQPDSATAQDLAWRWMQLLKSEVGGDEGLLMKYYAMQWHEPALQALSGIDRAGMTFIAHAMACRRMAIYATFCRADEMTTLREHYVACTTAWPPLIAALRAHMAQGADPGGAEVQELARQWMALESRKAGGDLALAAKLRQAFQREPALRFGSGIDEPLLAYLNRAMQQSEAAP